jgi:hypothetical protein
VLARLEWGGVNRMARMGGVSRVDGVSADVREHVGGECGRDGSGVGGRLMISSSTQALK